MRSLLELPQADWSRSQDLDGERGEERKAELKKGVKEMARKDDLLKMGRETPQRLVRVAREVGLDPASYRDLETLVNDIVAAENRVRASGTAEFPWMAQGLAGEVRALAEQAQATAKSILDRQIKMPWQK